MLARRFHKFWNIDELPESSVEVVQGLLSANANGPQPFSVTEKLDGSLVSPMLIHTNDATNDVTNSGGPELGVDGRELRWALRTVEAEDVASYARSAKESDYNGLALHLLSGADGSKGGVTPLFEWCTAGAAVAVIEHEVGTQTPH